MNIWIPESIYRVFPRVSFFSGLLFCLAAPSFATLVLFLVLAVYSLAVWRARSEYQ